MEALFLKLLNMSISASWLVLAVVVLRILMKKAPKWMTCALWTLVAIRLVFPFSIESMFSIVPSAQTLPPEILTNNRFEISSGIPVIDHQINDVVLDNYYEGVTVPNDMGFNFMSAAGTVWIIGLAALLVYALVSYLLIHRKVSASICLRENIYLCDYIESPFILGIIRPKIYLPSSLDQAQWPHVIAHEKAHLARRDHWWKPLGFVILCVYWFNPVLWLAYILLCKDIELACDERVIRNMDTRQKQDYTTALLECSMPRYLIAACPLAFGEVGVKERVKSVLNYKKPAFWIILIAIILCIAAAVCFLTDPVGKHSITPGTYNTVEAVFLQVHPNRQDHHTMAGRYILQDNTLYTRDSREPIVLGRMTPYDLSMEELKGYFQKDQWNRLDFHNFASISEALWLRLEDSTFYVWFTTSRGETYLACGVEDCGERYDEHSDDTFIAHIGRLVRDEQAEELELAWFDAEILETRDTWLLVSPIAGSWEAEQYGEIEVSRYWHNTATAPDGSEIAPTGVLPGDFSEGDRVRIVYDGNIQETYPARISNAYSTTKLSRPETARYDRIEEAILDGCVTMVNGDVVAGQQRWQAFIKQTQLGQSASVRLVTYHTLSSPINFDPGDFPDVFSRYPLLYIHDLSFDGTQYTLRVYGDGSEHISQWPHMAHFSDVEHSLMYRDYYVLTNTADLSWEDYIGSIAVSATPINTYPLYSDRLFTHEPSQAELEGIKNALEPYMLENKITSLDANELTHRLDVGVSEWVDGLDTLIEQFIDLDFVTITQQKGTLVLTERNDLISRFPDYFGLGTFKGLELYALEDGTYVLMAGTNRNKTEDEINALPRANAAEMKEILASYTNGAVLDIRDIFIDNRTDRTEYDIRKELGIFPPCQVNIEITNATSTEALIVYHINNLGPGEVWTGYDYHLEVLTDDGWVHYGYPPEELAWESALLFHTSDHYPLDSQNQEIFVANWSRTANAPLPPGTYRYCKGVTIYYDGEYTNQSLYAVFEVPADTPDDPGVHMEILNPTDTGATLAITYNGGLMGELSTQGKYYLMVDVGGGMTRYGLSPGQVAWGDGLYMLNEGETVFIDVRWDHTADAPLPLGTYYVVLTVEQNVPDNGAIFQFQKYITAPFAIID